MKKDQINVLMIQIKFYVGKEKVLGIGINTKISFLKFVVYK